jgi:hypothetical protein
MRSSLVLELRVLELRVFELPGAEEHAHAGSILPLLVQLMRNAVGCNRKTA